MASDIATQLYFAGAKLYSPVGELRKIDRLPPTTLLSTMRDSFYYTIVKYISRIITIYCILPKINLNIWQNKKIIIFLLTWGASVFYNIFIQVLYNNTKSNKKGEKL